MPCGVPRLPCACGSISVCAFRGIDHAPPSICGGGGGAADGLAARRSEEGYTPYERPPEGFAHCDTEAQSDQFPVFVWQMYADADEDGRASLSKAWEEGRTKREGKT